MRHAEKFIRVSSFRGICYFVAIIIDVSAKNIPDSVYQKLIIIPKVEKRRYRSYFAT